MRLAAELEYDIAVWSASAEDGVKSVVTLIWPSDVPRPVFIFTYDQCTVTYRYIMGQGTIISITKELSKVWRKYPRYKRETTLVLDNNPTTYKHNYGNAMPIDTFWGHRDDKEFVRISRQLRALTRVYNVRAIDREDVERSVERELEKEELLR